MVTLCNNNSTPFDITSEPFASLALNAYACTVRYNPACILSSRKHRAVFAARNSRYTHELIVNREGKLGYRGWKITETREEGGEFELGNSKSDETGGKSVKIGTERQNFVIGKFSNLNEKLTN